MDIPQRTDEVFQQNLAVPSREKKKKVVNFHVPINFDTILVKINVTTNGSSKRLLTH